MGSSCLRTYLPRPLIWRGSSFSLLSLLSLSLFDAHSSLQLFDSTSSTFHSHFRPAIEKAKLTLQVECEPDPQDGRQVYVDADFWEKIVFNLRESLSVVSFLSLPCLRRRWGWENAELNHSKTWILLARSQNSQFGFSLSLALILTILDLHHLVGNAFKYTLQGGITVKLSFNPEEVQFSVVDSGVGIPKSDISIVCERFHRVASVSRSHEGTGIGLSLCAELVGLLGGRLEVSSVFLDSTRRSRY